MDAVTGKKPRIVSENEKKKEKKVTSEATSHYLLFQQIIES